MLDLSYDYARNNSAGNLSGKTGHLTKITDNLNSDKNREYQFDALGRLAVAKGKVSSQWTQTYTYDRFGNRTSVAANGTAADRHNRMYAKSYKSCQMIQIVPNGISTRGKLR